MRLRGGGGARKTYRQDVHMWFPFALLTAMYIAVYIPLQSIRMFILIRMIVELRKFEMERFLKFPLDSPSKM